MAFVAGDQLAKALEKDRCMRRRCDYEMNASLAMHSRAHQDFLKEISILGMCIGERQKAVATNSAWVYVY